MKFLSHWQSICYNFKPISRLSLIINGRLQTLMPASVFVRQASFSPDMEEHPDNRPLYRDGTKLMDIRHVHKRLHDNIWRIFLLYKSIKVHLMKKKDRFDSNWISIPDIWWHIMTSDEGPEPYPGTIIYFADETGTHMVSKVVILSWNSGRSAGIH